MPTTEHEPQFPIYDLTTDTEQIVSTCIQFTEAPGFKEPLDKFLRRLALEKPPFLKGLIINGWKIPDEMFEVQMTTLHPLSLNEDDEINLSYDVIDKIHDSFLEESEYSANITCPLSNLNTDIFIADQLFLKQQLSDEKDEWEPEDENTSGEEKREITLFLLIKT